MKAKRKDRVEEGRKRINICLTPGTHEKGKELATEDNREFSNWLEVLIVREAQRRGIAKAA
jgi:hypothetical protein